MAEQETVITPEESAPATVFSFGPEEPVDAAQEAEPAGDGEQVPEAEQGEEEVAPDRAFGDQKEIGKAFAAERKRLDAQWQKRFDDDQARKVGLAMIRDMQEREGISYDEAAKRVDDNFYKALAKREGISPSLARRLYGSAKSEPEQADADLDAQSDQIIRDFYEAKKPSGFDDKAALSDPEFVEMLAEYGAKAAIRIYQSEKAAKNASQDVAEKLRARNSIPQMQRATQAVTPKTDWTQVDSDTFRREKERRSHLR